jgi:hypothetical protein
MMRRPSLPLAAALVLLIGLVALGGRSFAAAQEATPAAAAGDELAPGVTSEFITGAAVGELPPTPAFMVLVRLTMEPGAVLPADPNDPTGTLLLVESGTLAVRLGAPTAIASTLGPGESIYGAPFSAGELRNDGREPAVLLLAIIGPEEADDAGVATPAA